jgi:ribonuclease G
MNRILITKYGNGILSALYTGNRMEEALVENPENPSIIENIYVGKISCIRPNINAAFVNIGTGADAYLSLENNPPIIFVKKVGKKDVSPEDEILVQVAKEAQKGKTETLTTLLTFKGKTVFLIWGKEGLSVSSKIPSDQKARLSDLVRPHLPSGFGVMVRTNAMYADDEEILSELGELKENAEKSLSAWKHSNAFTCVRKSGPEYIAYLRNTYRSRFDEVLTDQEDIYQALLQKKQEEQDMADIPVRLYTDTRPNLCALYNVKNQVQRALGERVWMKSGAYLVIQPTEALTVIDVNSGKRISGKDKQKAIFEINLEAARECARQMRLRNLSGIILIDFIDMVDSSQEESLVEEMRRECAKDPVRVTVLGLTKLHLCEITRKKVMRPLAEQVKGIRFEEEEKHKNS